MKRRFYAWGMLVLSVLAGCTHRHSDDENAPADETVSITRWTDKTELFVEFSPLLVCKETPFAAHLTDLKTFKPVADGSLRVALTREQGKEAAAVAKAPTVA